MNWFESLVAFIVIWWLVLFMVLPWGVRIPDKAEPGHATSAPVRPRLWLKVAGDERYRRRALGHRLPDRLEQPHHLPERLTWAPTTAT